MSKLIKKTKTLINDLVYKYRKNEYMNKKFIKHQNRN